MGVWTVNDRRAIMAARQAGTRPKTHGTNGNEVTEEPAAGQVVVVTRDGLSDGSLLAAARSRMPPDAQWLSDAEIEADLDAMMARHDPGADAWLFGYGSLMWNPAFHFIDRQAANVRGWHRGYCLWLKEGRGTPANPGLMLALDRGGSCGGALLRIAASEARAELLLAWRRELFTGAYRSRWVTAMTPNGPIRAMTFVANRAHTRYVGRLDEATVAERIARADGALGSCRSYLVQTLEAVHALGLRDHVLERLRDRVAVIACTG
jgi:glutathione-specific gamma-glutamylcyclotransferase